MKLFLNYRICAVFTALLFAMLVKAQVYVVKDTTITYTAKLKPGTLATSFHWKILPKGGRMWWALRGISRVASM